MGFSRAEADNALSLIQSGDLSALAGVLRRLIQRELPLAITADSAVTLNDRDFGRMIYHSRAAGTTFTLPAATGSGYEAEIICGTTITSNSLKVQVANATDVMIGNVIVLQDGGDTMVGFEAASTSDTITLNGTTTGGIKGDRIRVKDVASGIFAVQVTLSATGTEATPFSAAV